MKKKIYSLLFTAVIITSFFAMTASAESNDTNFKFLFRGTGGGESMNQYTSRPKEDDSSSYLYLKAGGAAAHVRIYGTYVYDVIKREGNSFPSANNCTTPYYNEAVVKVGSRGFIRQLVYERGYPYAVPCAWGNGTILPDATGVWSPDSVPEAGVATLN